MLGRLEGVENGIVKLGSELHDNLAAADRAEVEFVKAVDVYVAATGMSAPEETLPVLRDGFDQKILAKLDLTASGITNLIWATGYSFDFSLVKLPVTDQDGFPIQTRGVSAYPGLFFVGLPWLHTAKSGLIYGLAEDARHIADRIAERCAAIEAASIVLPRDRSLKRSRSRETTRWADHVMALVWASALSLMLDGFASYAAGIYPAAPQTSPHQACSAIAPTDAPSGQS